MPTRRRYYPTPSKVKCYVNGIEIDDMFRIDFKRDVRHQPIYGYDDAQWGFVAKGKELVTGQLVINYRYPGYLSSVIRRATASAVRTERAMQPFREGANQSNPLAQQRALRAIDFLAFDGMEPEAQARYLANQMSAGLDNQAFVDALKARFEERFILDTRNEDGARSRWDSPLDYPTHIEFFDLHVRYGFNDQNIGFNRIFRDVVLIGESSVISAAAGAGNDMSSSAQAVLEVYPFFCRTVDIQSGVRRSSPGVERRGLQSRFN